ncbi:MAG TPA: cytosine permease [Candidatus Nitrosocosmicus sp.]|nr:cytosine permease [Candidatus Nitrosocosmicus sp.]
MKFLDGNTDFGTNPLDSKYKVLSGKNFFVLWSSLGIGLLVISAGSFISSSNLTEAIIAIIVGSIVGSILLALAGKIGSDHSIPSIVSMRPAFGLHGSYLLTVLNIFQLIGWSTFEITILSKAANIFSNGYIDFYIWSIVFGAVIILFCILGPLKIVKQWLSKFAVWVVYGSTIVMLISIILSTSGGVGSEGVINSHSTLSTTDSSTSFDFSFFNSLDLVIAMPLSWLPLVADYNRFAKKSKNAFVGTFIGFSITNCLFYIIGFLLGISDIFAILVAIQTFFYGFFLLVLIVDEVDNVFANIFSSAMSFKNIYNKINYKYLVIFFTALGVLLANLIPIQQYENFLLIIGALFAPLFAIVLTDYYVIRRLGRRITIEDFYEKTNRIKMSSFLAFGVGSITYFILSPISWLYVTDLGLSIGSTIPSVAISILVFLVIELLIKKVKLKNEEYSSDKKIE